MPNPHLAAALREQDGKRKKATKKTSPKTSEVKNPSEKEAAPPADSNPASTKEN